MAYQYTFQDIKHAANGKWLHILASIGIPQGSLKDKHQPCPLCGGKDRYRFDDKDGNGTYFCNQCGAGDGFHFVQKWQQCGFPEAVQTVARLVGLDSSNEPNRPPRPIPTPTPPKPQTDQLAHLQRIWNEAQPISGSQAEQYLINRGITDRVGVLFWFTMLFNWFTM